MRCENCGSADGRLDGGLWVCTHCGSKQKATEAATARLKCFACGKVGTAYSCALCHQYFCAQHADVLDALDVATCIGCQKTQKGKDLHELTDSWRVAWKQVSDLGRQLNDFEHNQEGAISERVSQQILVQTVLGALAGVGLGLVVAVVVHGGLGCLLGLVGGGAGAFVLRQRASSTASVAAIGESVRRGLAPQREKLAGGQQALKQRLLELEGQIRKA